MMTEGSNFTGIWDFALEHAGEEDIRLNAIKSNDVYAMLLTYGVEAARLTIVQEIQGIFGAYGIAVNSFMDSNKNPTPTFQGKLPPQGVKQLLEKKEGLFRKNMMVFAFAPLFLFFSDPPSDHLTQMLPLSSYRAGKAR